LTALFFVVLALGLSVAACGDDDDGGSDGAGGAAITIDDLTFTAESVAAGETVTVQNDDDVPHTVTGDDDEFNVSVDAGESATFTAPADAGDYDFHCNIHPAMKATLTVE
jgi:plastocyanin